MSNSWTSLMRASSYLNQNPKKSSLQTKPLKTFQSRVMLNQIKVQTNSYKILLLDFAVIFRWIYRFTHQLTKTFLSKPLWTLIKWFSCLTKLMHTKLCLKWLSTNWAGLKIPLIKIKTQPSTKCTTSRIIKAENKTSKGSKWLLTRTTF